MSVLGRTLTLLILLMSVGFLIVAVMVGASDRRWKAAADRMKQRASQATQAMQDTKANTQKAEKALEREKVGRALQLGNLESQNKAFREQLAQIQEQLRKEIQVSQDRLTQLERSENRLAAQDTQLLNLRNTNKKYVDDIATQFNEVRNLQTQIFEYRNTIEQLERDEADMVAKITKQDKVLFKADLNENSLTDHIAPKIEAVVTQVGANNLLSINIGKDDGIKIGHEMDITRGKRYVGKATVVRTQDNQAVLRSIGGMMRDRVREGDSVSTKL